MDKSTRFWDRIAERYSKQPIADEAAYQKKLQVTRKYFRPEMKALEFGCGTGSTAIAHAPYVKHILAIDISSKMIEIAQGKSDTKNIENVNFKQSSIDEFSVADQTLDAVLGLSILHLLDNKEEVIAKVHKMLKLGGANSVTGTVDGSPPQAFYIFIIAGSLAAAGEINVLVRRKLSQVARKTRHLWRMCFSFFIASGSLFFGQPQVFPDWFNGSVLPGSLAVVPLLVMIFWATAVRFGRYRRIRG